ncbi:sigma-54-dependent transcriptional regulator [Haloferula sp. A504]|uniref:sigma-54-dependent transcriptional regulator n=1 Tax=Haloferula sp. A504 TaxID=3373601 RepID=UPI0031C9DE3D|nr:response regulator [Verrucomicrobiaceae bacterium E54]
MKTLLIVEDHHALANAIAAAAERSGLETLLAPTLAKARDRLDRGPVDGILLDIGLPDGHGLDLMREWRWDHKPETAVITAHGEIGNAIDARKLGIARFLDKPVDFQELGAFFELVAAASPSPETPEQPAGRFSPFVGASPIMRPVFRQISHACASDQPVVIRGATGTGKSQVARLIQHASEPGRPFHILHASPLLDEDTLAGAVQSTRGGQLVIEAIDSLTAGLQTLLVRVLDQAKEHAPRLIVTTDEAGLLPRVNEGTLQQELYYRLQVLEIDLPLLRERRDDIAAISDCFLGELNAAANTQIAPEVLGVFANYDWPGNLRELRNAINYALVTSAGARLITPDHIPGHLAGIPARHGEDDALALALEAWVERRMEAEPDYKELSTSLENLLLEDLLRRFDGKPSHLASALAINRTTLRNKLRRIDR